MRVGDELRGSFWSFFCAAKNCSSVVAGFLSAAFSSARAAANLAESLMRFLLRSMAEVLGMANKSGGVDLGRGGGLNATERHAEELEELARLVVGVGGRDDCD